MNDKECRLWWRNCGVEPDEEIRTIDKLEDEISPLSEQMSRIRQLIGTIEMCHHKAEKWVDNILVAIGTGKTVKGLGARTAFQIHPMEIVWQNTCSVLSAWCAGSPSDSIDSKIGDKSAKHLLNKLGKRSYLKEWQVQRVVEKISGFVGFALPVINSIEYVPLVEYGTEYESALRKDCPKYYSERSNFWRQTVQTIIHDTVDGEPAEVSLAVAIDLLMPCNWNFLNNLEITLSSIGGDLTPATPLALCARNIKLSPIRDKMFAICRNLRGYCRNKRTNENFDKTLVLKLGKPTKVKKWLTASLEKTIRLQMSL